MSLVDDLQEYEKKGRNMISSLPVKSGLSDRQIFDFYMTELANAGIELGNIDEFEKYLPYAIKIVEYINDSSKFLALVLSQKVGATVGQENIIANVNTKLAKTTDWRAILHEIAASFEEKLPEFPNLKEYMIMYEQGSEALAVRNRLMSHVQFVFDTAFKVRDRRLYVRETNFIIGNVKAVSKLPGYVIHCILEAKFEEEPALVVDCFKEITRLRDFEMPDETWAVIQKYITPGKHMQDIKGRKEASEANR